ncbi:MAG: toprim domain-containing protein [Candidatus Saccharimonadales bacterium]
MKANLKIETVLSHYGLSPDKNGMIKCPFHDDKTPSMQVYTKTNTVFCFSSNCDLNGKGIDQIDFILHKEKCTKHEAILKAKSILGVLPEQSNHSKPKTTPQPTNNNGTDLARIAILSKLMAEAEQSIRRSEKAKTYLDERNLELEKSGVGYLAERFHNSWNEIQKQSAIEVGILNKRKNGMLSPVFKNCIVFPIKNKDGRIINIYGRSVLPDKKDTAKHFYLKGAHRGIFPNYPSQEVRHLILTESIIDAQSLLQLEDLKDYGIIALYGTNGLTSEIKSAIKELKELEEVILFFDGDPAGEKAIEKYGEELHELSPKARISKVNTPENEDINSLLVAHEPEIFIHLIHERETLFSFSNEKNASGGSPSNEKKSDQEKTDQPEQRITKLQTDNPDKLIYQTDQLTATVWGGIEYGNMHRLKLSLHLENHENDKSFRDDVNLYSHRGKKAFLQDAAEELGTPQAVLKEYLEDFTREIEVFRMEQKEQFKAKLKPDIVTLNELEKAEAIKLLKSNHLIKELKGAMKKTGLIGETDNGLLLFLIFLTRNFDYPLHALVHGSSGSGKTNLLKSILKLVPEESKYSTTALTENVLFRPPFKDFWKHKILLLEDLDGSYKALYPLREFMTNQFISKLASEPDPKTGQFKQVQLEAQGPIVIAGATTKDRIYEDNSNRSFLIHVNESKSHQEEILNFQNKLAAGLVDDTGIEKAVHKIQNIQRLLSNKIKVINPFQPELKLPEYVFKKLRTNTHYITLIKSITFLHQYQRKHQKNQTTGEIFIQTTLEDIALANTLSKQSLLRKSDELSGEVREFFESLKREVKQSDQTSFVSKELREKFRMHPMKFNRRINELKNRGYIKQTGGNYKTSYEYEITVFDDYMVLQKGLDIMDEILDKLYKKYPDGVYTAQKRDVLVNS